MEGERRMVVNPLKRIFENNQKIAILKEEIKKIEAESQKCLDYAMVKKIETSGHFVLRTHVSTRREPISSKVVSAIGSDDALKIAKFNIKDLEKLMGEDELNALCKVNESVKRVVEKVEE
jgi:hypothetical protein